MVMFVAIKAIVVKNTIEVDVGIIEQWDSSP
jgi:hypothetical protein